MIWAPAVTLAGETWREGNSSFERTEKGLIRTIELTVTPREAPVPALKYRLMPTEFNMIDGNSAPFYLKAMGFIEQEPSRSGLQKYRQEQSQRAKELGGEQFVPPQVWFEMTPAELPQQAARDYLKFTDFQKPLLAEAAKRKHFDMERNLREAADPLTVLLPEIQQMRELARVQRVRCRLALSENRLDDAFAIMCQQYTAAWHLGKDDVLISNLVGAAISSMIWDDALYYISQPDAPNLYWAFAALPDPLVSMEKSLDFERQILLQQIPVLREVTEELQPVGYWEDFIQRLLPQIETVNGSGGGGDLLCQAWSTTDDPLERRAAVVGFIAQAYAGAKRYLVEERHLSPGQVEAYPTAQTVFLAMTIFHDQWRDEQFKWRYLPPHDWENNPGRKGVEKRLIQAIHNYGPFAKSATYLLPASSQALEGRLRTQQKIALIQTVEAIRMYGAQHHGQLPASLNDLPVPAPIEPYTNLPVQYEVNGDQALLTGVWRTGIQFRISLKFAPEKHAE